MREPPESKEVKEMYSLMIDSGAHSLQHNDFADMIKNHCANPNLKTINDFTHEELAAMRRRRARDGNYDPFSYYKTKEFWDYVDLYAKFIKTYGKGIDYYINVDVIFQPQLSWDVLKYLEEEHGLNPIPVIHHNTDLKWLKKHIEAGYKYIGFGGLARQVPWQHYHLWGDQVFEMLCDTPNRKPVIKAHGFAMTSFWLMKRYPWWSVDSASWCKEAAYGAIYIPYKKKGRKGEYQFDKPPYSVFVSLRSPKRSLHGKHYLNATQHQKMLVHEWLDYIDMPFGKVDSEGVVTERGVGTYYNSRNMANLIAFEYFRKSLPEWPWTFEPTIKRKRLC